MDYSSEEEVEFEIEVDVVNNVQPYMFEPLASSSDEENAEESIDDIDAHRIAHTEWCECGQCVPMTTGTESLCCMEVNNTDPKMAPSTMCIVEEEEFKAVCTTRAVITTAMVVYLHDNGPIPDIPNHEALRYTAYRQWTAWIHGKLGKKYRLPIPSCVVKKIREAFPSPTGIYKGFEYATIKIEQ